MKKIYLLSLILLSACSSGTTDQQIENWKEEIRETEKAFSDMADSAGIARAFEAFAAEDAVLMRANRIIEGRQSIAELYGSQPESGKLSWAPDFIDVSSSGDLGYTYGKYVYLSMDSLGKEIKSEGIFHTVWKKQNDGTWKFVWD